MLCCHYSVTLLGQSPLERQAYSGGMPLTQPGHEHGGLRGSPLALRQLKDQLPTHHRSSTLGTRALWTNKQNKAGKGGWF